VVLMLEELGRHLVPALVAETLMASLLLKTHANAEQQQAWLGKLAGGDLTIAAACLEPGHALDEIALSAKPNGDGWVLEGQKALVPHAELADCLLVAARSPASPDALLFLVPRDSPGITLRRQPCIDPMTPLFGIEFSEVAVEGHAKLDDSGGAAFRQLITLGAFAACAQGVGCAGRAMETAIDYARTRRQFDRPIGSFQAIKHQAANMLMDVETSRSAIYNAAMALSRSEEEGRMAVAMAKSYTPEATRRTCNAALQMHGGMGFTWDCDVHLYLRRAKYHEYTYGTTNRHREWLARHLASESGAPRELEEKGRMHAHHG
jgi:alkylation response protein AidB-like acyl-CoA dehydrogenase